jgi:hypothetical protein
MTRLNWINANEAVPDDPNKVVLVWAAQQPPANTGVLAPLLAQERGSVACVLARFGLSWLDGWLGGLHSSPPEPGWLLVPDDVPFKPGFVRYWCEVEFPPQEEH